MPVSRLDVLYRKILLAKFFTKGWGSPKHLQRLFDFRRKISNRETCYKLVPKDYSVTIINPDKFFTCKRNIGSNNDYIEEITRSDCRILEGKFRTPLAVYLPGLIPEEVQDSFFQMILPLEWKSSYKPICIHLAGTGDHYFWRRRNIMAKPLLKAGIGAIILENPYYGIRKPKDQIRSSLHYVSDIFVMGGCLILECLVLLHWCEQLGLGPLGITGISMGGHMASLAASNWPKPLVLVPCLSWSSASSVFTEGVMSDSIDWDMLQEQFKSNRSYCDDLSKLCRIVDNPFACDLSNSPDRKANSPYLPFKDRDVTNITPYQLINFMSCGTCPDIMLKPPSKHVEPISSTNNSMANFFKKSNQLKRNKVVEMKKRDREALWFMRGVMDECTHLKNFSVPYDTSLIISICASADGYVPRLGLSNLEDIWPGATVKYVDCGHVGAYIWHRKVFRESIIEAFERAKKKYKPTSASQDDF